LILRLWKRCCTLSRRIARARFSIRVATRHVSHSSDESVG